MLIAKRWLHIFVLCFLPNESQDSITVFSVLVAETNADCICPVTVEIAGRSICQRCRGLG
jgi:hypothetical protein